MNLLSIIIPAHNEAALLPDCLGSLVATRGPHEVILVDAESTDATAEIGRQFGARIVPCPAGDVSVAHNTGALAAQGDWLLFLDADTGLSCNLAAELLQAIRSGRFIGGSTTVFWRPDSIALRMANMAIARGRMLAGSFVFCRADFYPGWPPEKAGSTRGLWQMLNAAGKLAVLKTPITLRREPTRARNLPQNPP